MLLLLLVPWKLWLPLTVRQTQLANFQKLSWWNAYPQILMAVMVTPAMAAMEEIQP